MEIVSVDIGGTHARFAIAEVSGAPSLGDLAPWLAGRKGTIVLDEVARLIPTQKGDRAATLVGRGQHDYRRALGMHVRLHLIEDVDAAHVGQAQIKHDQVRSAGSCLNQSALNTGCFVHLKPFSLQCKAHEAPDLLLVLDQEDLGCRIAHEVFLSGFIEVFDVINGWRCATG